MMDLYGMVSPSWSPHPRCHYHQLIPGARERLQEEFVMTESEERFRQLIELSPNALVVQSENKIVYVNPSGAALFGIEKTKELFGKSLWEFVPPRYQTIVEKRCQEFTENGPPAPPIEMAITRVDGQHLDVEITATPLIYAGKPAIQAVFHDITTRKLVEEQIRQRSIELAALNAIAETVSQSLDLKKILNDTLEGVTQLEILGEETQGMIFLLDETGDALYLAAHYGAPKDHPCLIQPPKLGECLCGLAVQEGEPVISDNCYDDKRHTRCWDDMPPHKDICLPLMVRGSVLGAMDVRLPQTKEIGENIVELLSSVADQVSIAIENARLFDEVRLQSERLRTLSKRLAEIEDAERRRIAAELHDQVGESLTALGINLGIMRKQLKVSGELELNKYVDDSLALVDKTTERIRDVMSELRPPMLDDYGLMTTLRAYGEQFSNRTGINIIVSGDEMDPRFPDQVEIALFRIATEALTNVAKHAAASQVNVAIEFNKDSAQMMISDDGIGFDTRRTFRDDQNPGWGLMTMSERAESVGGVLRIESRINNIGTRVMVEVPR
jgi:PAS domain S-box-containing protein